MLISFITPVYNGEKYLSECIESVINQTNPSWEMIIVDDGSTDGSSRICREYSERDERIRLISKENTGQFDSRFKGIMAAKGEYCTGLDADDFLEKDCVEKLISVLEEKQYDIVAWNLRTVEEGKAVQNDHMDRYGLYTRDEFLEYVISSTNHSFCNKLIRTKMLKSAFFGDVPLDARHSEDLILICPGICSSDSIIAIDEILYNYRQISDSVTHSYSGKRVLDYLNSSMCIRAILDHYSMLSPRIVEAVNTVLVSLVGNCLKQATRSGSINEDEKAQIRSNPVYLELKRYEVFGNATKDIIVFMKLFRLRLDILISLLYRNNNG